MVPLLARPFFSIFQSGPPHKKEYQNYLYVIRGTSLFHIYLKDELCPQIGHLRLLLFAVLSYGPPYTSNEMVKDTPRSLYIKSIFY